MINTTGIELGTKKVRDAILASITILILFAGLASNIMPNFAMAQVDNSTNTTNNTITPLPPILENATGENKTAIGEQISDFVHHAVQIFQQQREETIASIKACHASLANATGTVRDQIRDNCKANLSAIHEKFADERTKYHELFTNFKSNARVFLKEARGLHVDPNEKKQTLDKIMDIRHNMKMEGKQDVLHGIRDIMKGHAMINSGHPMMGQEAIQKGKHQIGEAMHDIKKSK